MAAIVNTKNIAARGKTRGTRGARQALPGSKTKRASARRPRIGFVGQGFIGKNYADDFERRGFPVIRYGKEPQFVGNKEKIKECEVVFIAVPTPTTVNGFDRSAVEDALSTVGAGGVAVIKSTIIPGTTEKLQQKFPKLYVIHSPEFLTEATAAYDAAHPSRNIVGIPKNTRAFKEKAATVLSLLPPAPFASVMSAREAEMVKYANNTWFFAKVVFMNLIYDTAKALGCRFDVIRDAMAADPRVGRTHLDPVHKSGRGAGGRCFIKDFKAFSDFYRELVGDRRGLAIIESLQEKNLELLVGSNKNLDLISGVYGHEIIDRYTKD